MSEEKIDNDKPIDETKECRGEAKNALEKEASETSEKKKKTYHNREIFTLKYRSFI